MKIFSVLLSVMICFSSYSMTNQRRTSTLSKIASTICDFTCATALCSNVGKAYSEIKPTKSEILKQIMLSSTVLGQSETNNLVRMLSSATGRFTAHLSSSIWISILFAPYLLDNLPFMKITLSTVATLSPWIMQIYKFNKAKTIIEQVLNYTKL